MNQSCIVLLSLLVLRLPLDLGAQEKFKDLRGKAERGGARAAYELAEALYWADGVHRNLEQSAKYSLVGAKKHNPLAQYRYAVMQLLGQGVEQDVNAGFVLLAKAIPGLQTLAEQDNPDALYKTGKLYQLGLIKSNYFNPDDKKALASFRAAAGLGHARAAYMAGHMERLGLGTSRDSRKAFNLYKNAASKGFAPAAFYLWVMHDVEGGKMASQDDAVRYLKQAAESGFKNAQGQYGKALGEGKMGLKEDKKAALPWIQKAAKQGDETSQLLLGLMYASGSEKFGLKKDAAAAAVWFMLAARTEKTQIRAKAQNLLNGVRSQIDPLDQLDLLKKVNAFIAEETVVTKNASMGLEGASNSIRQSLRLDNLIMAAESGDREAMFSLGEFYLSQEELQKAESWLVKSAQKGFVSAMEALGFQYIRGGFGEPDFEKGSQWLKKTAAEGSVRAMNMLGRIALAGRLPGAKPADAVNWFMQGAEKGDAQAQTLLGQLLCTGDVVKQDLKGGLKWMQKATAQSYPPAEAGLAIIYAQGPNGVPDYDKAAKWARRGAMQGDHSAQRTLGFLYLEGKGVEPSKLSKREDHKRLAFKWLTLAKNGGIKNLDSPLKHLREQLSPEETTNATEEAGRFRPEIRYNPNK